MKDPLHFLKSSMPFQKSPDAIKEPCRIHFIGIGGVGMSGIAQVAKDQGNKVSGSDIRSSRYTDALKEAGIPVFIGHEASHIDTVKPDIVVVSTAILPNNPEYKRAQELGCEIWHRARMLAYLGESKQTLAVVGTHGKTTTSSMLAYVLDALGTDPSFLVGGIVRSYQRNARSGKGAYYVCEADESDKSFTYLKPFGILATNIEADHLDHYKDLNEIHDKFEEFFASLDTQGKLVLCGDDPALRAVAEKSNKDFVSYGIDSSNDICVFEYRQEGIKSQFSLRLPNGEIIHSGLKQNPGIHNVLNAAGVLAIIWALGEDVERAAAALRDFAGVKRRFDLVDEVNDITIVDDYAHHPTEIAATIKAAKDLNYKRLVVVFQPHRYSRVSLFTEVLHDDFSHAFDLCDLLIFTDVYSAGETPVPGVTGKTFLDVVLKGDKSFDYRYIENHSELALNIAKELCAGDLLITMGAGDVTTVGPELARILRQDGC